MALMTSQRLELLRHPQTEYPADLTRGERYIFRTRPGTVKALVHQMDLIPDGYEGKHADFYLRRWEKRNPDKKQVAVMKAVRDAVGSSAIKFIRIQRKNECYFATDNPVVAGYLRALVEAKTGDFQYVYEENGASVVVAGEMVYPNTMTGRRAAIEYAAEHQVTVQFVDNDEHPQE